MVEKEVEELLKRIEQKLGELEARLDGIEELLRSQNPKGKIAEITANKKCQALSEIKPSNPEKFAEAAEKQGVVVIKGQGDAMLVDPIFWRRFKERIHGMRSVDPARQLPDPERKLFEWLRQHNLVIGDTSGSWRIIA